ncbi:MAG: protein kinase [Candidatus Eremiobacteraeota bacterium]|nr:protein kinase [Candidatus Eremiobacteraeota bacterium]
MLNVALGSTLQDRYHITELLGNGAHGVVWKATDLRIDRIVALKRYTGGVLTEDAIREARLTARSLHQNIVSIYDVMEIGGHTILVMECVEGQSLGKLIRQAVLNGGWISEQESLLIIEDCLHGLSSAHRQGLMHRDIKPDNILLTETNRAKIADFGIAKKAEALLKDASEFRSSQAFAATGTLAFMSPEQASGRQLCCGTDVFSLGIIAYLLLARRHPFVDLTGSIPTVDLIKNPQYLAVPLGEANPQLADSNIARLVDRMLSKDVASRFQNAAFVLEEFLRNTGSTNCVRCAAENSASAKFCNQCAQPLQPSTSAAFSGDGRIEPDALVEQGYLLANKGDWTAAISKYTQALSADSQHPKALANIGFALNRVGRHQEAIEFLDRALDIAEHHSAYYYRAFARSKLKDDLQAHADLDRSISLARDYVPALFLKAVMLSDGAEYSGALQYLGEVLSIEPGNPRALALQSRLIDLTRPS